MSEYGDPSRRDFVKLVTGAVTVAAGSLAPRVAGAAVPRSSSFRDIVRHPDVATAYQGMNRPFVLSRSGDAWGSGDVSVQVAPASSGHSLKIVLASPSTSLSHLHLRWNAPLDRSLRILGDAWERSYGDLAWQGFVPWRALPWYFLTFDGHAVHGYGVETSAHATCFWQVDPSGISFWADVRNGGNPVELGARRLEVATIVCREGSADVPAMDAAKEFCRKMCAAPRLPKNPIYGANDWNYAYGKNTQDGIVREADLVASVAPRSEHKPTIVIDDGWQDKGRFPDLTKLAASISERGIVPGIWIRPITATKGAAANELLPLSRFSGEDGQRKFDPSTAEGLAGVQRCVREATGCGYRFLKHDFSTWDLFGKWGFEMGSNPTYAGWNFADRTRTNAEILLGLYTAIREAAGETTQILGCNTVGHLTAGLFESQRTGDDTSGRWWERNCRMGVNTLAFRYPQHRTFFHLDPDCVAITTATKWEDNRMWLDLVSQSGASLFVSPQPEATGKEQMDAIREAFARVLDSTALPEDWMNNTMPEQWRLAGERGEVRTYPWGQGDGLGPLEL